MIKVDIPLHSITMDNPIIRELELKDYARRMKVLHPELNVLPGTEYFMITLTKDKRPLISTCR